MKTLLAGFMPEIAYVLCALLAVGLDLALGKRMAREGRALLSIAVGRLAAALALAGALIHEPLAGPASDFFAVDALSTANRIGVAFLLWLTLETAAAMKPHAKSAEAVALALFAACGLSLLGAAQNLLSGFLVLELAGLSLYAFVGLERRRLGAAEAALKYFLFGGLAAAFLLFGFSYLYGATGTLDFGALRTSLAQGTPSALSLLAVVFVLVGLAYKVAAAPFHAWAPDVYEGGHAFPVSLVASASKLAGLAFFIRLLSGALEPLAGSSSTLGWVAGVAILSGVSLVLGNVAALAQTKVRRVLAYSAIGHAGALLLGLIVGRTAGPAAVVYYAITYGIATVVLFGAIGIAEEASGEPLTLGNLPGFSKRSPFLSFAMGVALLSLAGIPPLAGFFGKFFVFLAAFRIGGINTTAGILALLALAVSAVGLFYYLRVLKAMWVDKAPAVGSPIEVVPSARLSLGFAVALLLVLGLKPSLLLGLFP